MDVVSRDGIARYARLGFQAVHTTFGVPFILSLFGSATSYSAKLRVGREELLRAMGLARLRAGSCRAMHCPRRGIRLNLT